MKTRLRNRVFQVVSKPEIIHQYLHRKQSQKEKLRPNLTTETLMFA